MKLIKRNDILFAVWGLYIDGKLTNQVALRLDIRGTIKYPPYKIIEDKVRSAIISNMTEKKIVLIENPGKGIIINISPTYTSALKHRLKTEDEKFKQINFTLLG